eukprot:CAMPEP_0114004860 /NCGR_PEP_ID=MMETSP0372-20130328/2906_1 /TAXON_ID=340204 /ORGANISM="Lankesteria abbotti" /LENGTH=45 /assembly_acc=CAM_ASM_000359
MTWSKPVQQEAVDSKMMTSLDESGQDEELGKCVGWNQEKKDRQPH